MLTKELSRSIIDFVSVQPRTVQEIAQHIDKSWLTADRYIQKIAQEDGQLSTKTFRGGTRGALKIVYVTAQQTGTSIQQRLQTQIEAGRQKEDFNASEIYQYIDKEKKDANLLSEDGYESADNFVTLKAFLFTAETQVLYFSGNLTFAHISDKKETIFDVLEQLAVRGVSVKILTRVEIAGIEAVQKILAINHKHGKELIAIRHCYQPLRCIIIDDNVCSLRDTQFPEKYAKGELQKITHIIYRIYDKDWITWLQAVFWKLYQTSIIAQKRLEDIEHIKDL